MFETPKDRLTEVQLYELVAEEIERNQQSKGLWAKAIADTEGDFEKAKALYIKLRVQMIKDEWAEEARLTQEAEEEKRRKQREKREEAERKRQAEIEAAEFRAAEERKKEKERRHAEQLEERKKFNEALKRGRIREQQERESRKSRKKQLNKERWEKKGVMMTTLHMLGWACVIAVLAFAIQLSS